MAEREPVEGRQPAGQSCTRGNRTCTDLHNVRAGVRMGSRIFLVELELEKGLAVGKGGFMVRYWQIHGCSEETVSG